MRLDNNRQPQYELTSRIRLTGAPLPVSRPGDQTRWLFTRLKLVQCRLLVRKLLVMECFLTQMEFEMEQNKTFAYFAFQLLERILV